MKKRFKGIVDAACTVFLIKSYGADIGCIGAEVEKFAFERLSRRDRCGQPTEARVSVADGTRQFLKTVAAQTIQNGNRDERNVRAALSRNGDVGYLKDGAAGFRKRSLELVKRLRIAGRLYGTVKTNRCGKFKRFTGQFQSIVANHEFESGRNRTFGTFLRKELFKAMVFIAVDDNARQESRVAFEGFVQRNAYQARTQLLGAIDAQTFEFFLGRQIHQAVAVGDFGFGGDVDGGAARVYCYDLAHGLSRALGRIECRNLGASAVDEVVRRAASKRFLGVRLKGKSRDAHGSALPVLASVFFQQGVNFAAVVCREIFDVFGAFEASFDLKA